MMSEDVMKFGEIVLDMLERIEPDGDEISHPIELPCGMIVDIVVRPSVEMDRFDV